MAPTTFQPTKAFTTRLTKAEINSALLQISLSHYHYQHHRQCHRSIRLFPREEEASQQTGYAPANRAYPRSSSGDERSSTSVALNPAESHRRPPTFSGILPHMDTLTLACCLPTLASYPRSLAISASPPWISRPRRPLRPHRIQRKVSIMATTRPIESLQGQVNAEGITVEGGEGGLPKIVLTDATGSQAEIYAFGACITSWKLPNGKDMLFVRPDAVFNGKKPISGGIPHCFPQFGPGPIQQHGFARNLTWSIAHVENIEGSPSVVFELKDNDYTREMWNHGFQASYKVFLQPTKLSTTLMIKNNDDKPFSFTTALHTYFRASVTGAIIKGLKGCRTLNKDPDPVNPQPGIEEREEVTFPGFVDCIYVDAPQELLFINGLGDNVAIRNEGWSDAVLWNPHLNAPAAYKDFVCVENAKINDRVILQPGEKWEASQILSICR